MEIFSILFLSASILNATSTFLAAITAYLYFWLPNVQDSHGTCVFHFSLNIALIQAYIFTTETIMKTLYSWIDAEYCMVEIYVQIFLVTAVCIWSAILSYNTWKEVKQIQDVNQTYPTGRLNCYRFLGYGVPILYVVFIIHFYQPLIIRPFKVCFLYASFLRLPIFGSIVLNVFFFIDLQRRLWNLLTRRVHEIQNENPSSRSSTNIVALNYRMCLNLKLSLTMNIPLSLSAIIFMILADRSRNFSNWKLLQAQLGMVYHFMQCLQGTFIFLAAVVFRKRVIKGFIKYGNQSCLRFVRIPECLRSPANDNVEETDDNTGTHPEEVYTSSQEEVGMSLSLMASLTSEDFITRVRMA